MRLGWSISQWKNFWREVSPPSGITSYEFGITNQMQNGEFSVECGIAN